MTGGNIWLWLDDIREPPDKWWTWVKTAEAAIDILKTGRVSLASLDHDLDAGAYAGTPREKTGYDVLCWMERHGVWPLYGCVVHSQNPVGRLRMEQVIQRQRGVGP